MTYEEFKGFVADDDIDDENDIDDFDFDDDEEPEDDEEFHEEYLTNEVSINLGKVKFHAIGDADTIKYAMEAFKEMLCNSAVEKIVSSK